MAKYLVKYTVLFVDQNISVSDELDVKEGEVYFDVDTSGNKKVVDKDSAIKFVLTKYNQNEDNVVIIPQKVWDSKVGLGDTKIIIKDVSLLK